MNPELTLQLVDNHRQSWPSSNDASATALAEDILQDAFVKSRMKRTPATNVVRGLVLPHAS